MPYSLKFVLLNCCHSIVGSSKDGSEVRSEFGYYVPRTLNCTVPAYRTSIQFLKRTVPTYRTRSIIKKKKAQRTSVLYFSAKIEAHRTVLTYHTVPYWHQGCRSFLSIGGDNLQFYPNFALFSTLGG